MLKKEVLSALNQQINQELTAAYGYLALSIYFDRQVLKGFARYFRKQQMEEHSHAMRLLDYVQDRGSQVQLTPVSPPTKQFESLVDGLKFALEAERANTAAINAVYAVAVKENDLATQNHLQWFLKEQVEEEKWAEELLAQGEQVGSCAGPLFMLDHHVGKRVDKEE